MIVLYYIISFFFIIILFKKKKEFIYLLPLFHIFIDTGFSYFSTFSFLTFFRPIFVIIILIFFFKELKLTRLHLPFYIFFVYLSVLVLFSNEIIYSLRVLIQIIISMIFFVIGFYYLNNTEKLQKLNNTLIIVLIFSLIVTAVGYLFNIGKRLEYTIKIEDAEDRVGLLGSGGLYTGGLIISLLPIIIPKIKRYTFKLIVIISAILLFIFILLNVRRTAILIPLVGLLTYVLFTPRKIRIMLTYILSFIILILFSYFYEDLLIKRYQIREKQGRFKKEFYKDESRYLENVQLYKEYIKFEDPLKSFFGIGVNIFAEHIENNKVVKRMYHSDIAKLLSGSGFIGLILYIIIYIFLFRLFKKKRQIDANMKKLRAIGYSLIFISLLVSLNGSLTLVNFRTVLFLYLGAVAGIYRVNIKKYNIEALKNKKKNFITQLYFIK